jgi:MFS family permease
VPFLPYIYRLIAGIITIVFLGYAFVGVLVPTQTFLQEKTPGGYRGRVFGNYWFIVTIATIFPVIFSGTLAELFGVKTLMATITVTVVGVLLFIKKYADRLVRNGFYLKHIWN